MSKCRMNYEGCDGKATEKDIFGNGFCINCFQLKTNTQEITIRKRRR